MSLKQYTTFLKLAVAMLCLACGISARAQMFHRWEHVNFDSVKISRHKYINNVFQQAVNSIRRTPNDTGIILNGKSEAPYLPYEGKVIRHIKVEAFDFERNLSDTTQRSITLASRLANLAHTNTRAFVVRNNLFIKENTPVNAFKIADNERYLRTLNYINDARIVIDTIIDNPDSVDVLVITKDFFNLSIDGASNGANHINLHFVDANIAGLGQTVELYSLYDYTRKPDWAYGALYHNYNIGHSFIDAAVGYNQFNGSPYTKQEETAEYVQLLRQLVSPYSHFAGAFTLGHYASYNSYNQPEWQFYKYDYNLYDGWIGYNIAIHKLTETNNTIRDRRVFAIRYFDYQFNKTPEQIGNMFDPVYNSKRAILGQLTFFRQDYFKTQYIYGFGTTEDLPYGYNISVTAGWHRQLNMDRPYAGVNAFRYIATPKGDFLQFYLRTGGFLYHDKVQDGSLLVGATAYSRILFWNNTKIRQYLNVSYTHLYNRVTYAPLRINNDYGVRGFLSDSAEGIKRFTMQFETEFYLKYKILGFQFAPFPYADLSLLTPANAPYWKSQLYSGVGGGVRARNENLVFETIELRAYFFPVAPNNMRGFKIILTSNLRYRYQSNFVTQPDEVNLNNSAF